ncbi:hypothetical protein, conserved [Trypanosoma brucei gambiense DAL972]|uniref:PTP1-interacting protein, 39 kDa n=1 Tax=Trypanosoma brucei gambiense (strain MHOM/CI/86/DAL972) TaxID=679716 RepID=D0A245_TRYB9|nr:LOW QUALITY PROTEIN: hypothetical protein, conserved [Trypanosoma brucei gambiense DAL972]CBH15338.1 hypothetical protein, conserved [Trypanosoma brucei gambiense DAL972]|eukprot:XP_011777603.1 LOW QUALITY PROTEIN: hypothetical protein, conserved [Trypanosoma brucei gambiense DAL972]
MPRLLLPCGVELINSSTSQPHDMLVNEEQRGLEERSVLNAEMDFFTDEYLSAHAGATRPHTTTSGNTRETCNGEQGSCVSQERTTEGSIAAIDCDVSLQLIQSGRGSGHSVVYTVRVPAAVSFSSPSTESELAANGSATSLRLQQIVNSEWRNRKEEMTNMGGAWEGRESTPTAATCCCDAFDCEEAAAGPNYPADRFRGRRLATSKATPYGTGADPSATHFGETFRNAAFSISETGINPVSHLPPVCAVRLPPDFVFGLRLPPDTERRLVELYNGGSVTLREVKTPKIPKWLTAFLYTSGVRCQLSTPLPSTPETRLVGGLMNKLSAVSVLEGFCIAALHVVSHMGELRLHNGGQKLHVSETAVVDDAQRWLLDEGGIFAHTQEEQIRLWLHRYVPQEAYTNGRDGDVAQRDADSTSVYPSAVAVVYYIAIELARGLFPCILSGLEATILTALQPLLSAQTLIPEVSGCRSSRLPRPASHNRAISLLTQSPMSWWWWWRQRDSHSDAVERDCNGKNKALSSFPLRCPNAVATARGYGAVRVLKFFSFFCVEQITGETRHVEEAREFFEVAQFLASSSALFSELLLDREVMSVLERTTTEVGKLTRKETEDCGHGRANAEPSQVTRILMRCFVVLICWMAFRPSGYSRSLARTYFAYILRPASCLCELSMNRGMISGAAKKGWVNSALVACVHDYFSKISSLLHAVRGFSRPQRRRRQQADFPSRNPWRPLGCTEEVSVLGNGDCGCNDDQTTVTSRSHASASSFLPTHSSNGIATNPAHHLLTRGLSCATSEDELIFSSHSLRLLRHAIRHARGVLQSLRSDVLGTSECTAAFDVVTGSKRFRESSGASTLEGAYDQCAPQCEMKCACAKTPQLHHFLGECEDPSLYVGGVLWSVSSEDEEDSAGIFTTSTTTNPTTPTTASNSGTGSAIEATSWHFVE